jgi:acyl-CoA thioesterase
MLRALMEHPERLGDPLAVTVNFCAPIEEGPFDLDVRLIKANRSTQHWSVELTQNAKDAAAFATAVFAVRRESWSHRPARPPQATPFDATRRLPKSTFSMSWVHQFDFRFVAGAPSMDGAPNATPASARSVLWIGDATPRKIDGTSLLAVSDAFFARIFHVRGELVPFGTVSMTTYFHVAMADLDAAGLTHVLAAADAKVFNKSYADQTGELWSPDGQLLATTQQIAYFKA